MEYKKIFQSRTFTVTLWTIGGVVIVLAIFQAGVLVGYHKAGFSYQGGENYYLTFGDDRPGPLGIPAQNFPTTHGAIGKIIKIDLPTITIEDTDNVEKVVSVDDDTMIKKFRDTMTPAQLHVGDIVTVIGSPTDTAQIEARLVRILPPPPSVAAHATTTVKN